MSYIIICGVALIVSGLTLFPVSDWGRCCCRHLPCFEKLSFDPKYIPIGGGLSGFFGGLSGHQGALRIAFLIRAGLQKEIFIRSMVVSAVMVDISRLLVYGSIFFARDFEILRPGRAAGS